MSSLLDKFLSLEIGTLQQKSTLNNRSGPHQHINSSEYRRSICEGQWKKIRIIAIDCDLNVNERQQSNRQKPRHKSVPLSLDTHAASSSNKQQISLTQPVTPSSDVQQESEDQRDDSQLEHKNSGHDNEEEEGGGLLDSRLVGGLSVKGRRRNRSTFGMGDTHKSAETSSSTLTQLIDQQVLTQSKLHKYSLEVNGRLSDQVRVAYSSEHKAVLVPSSLLSNYFMDSNSSSSSKSRSRRETDRTSVSNDECGDDVVTDNSTNSTYLMRELVKSSFSLLVSPFHRLQQRVKQTRNFLLRTTHSLCLSSTTRRVLGQQREMVCILQDMLEAVGFTSRSFESSSRDVSGSVDRCTVKSNNERQCSPGTSGVFVHCLDCDEKDDNVGEKQTEGSVVEWFIRPLASTGSQGEQRMCLAVVRLMEARDEGETEEWKEGRESEQLDVCCDRGGGVGQDGDYNLCSSSRSQFSSPQSRSNSCHNSSTRSTVTKRQRVARVAAIAFSGSSGAIPHPFDSFFSLLDSCSNNE
eukprot:gene33540-41388_t